MATRVGVAHTGATDRLLEPSYGVLTGEDDVGGTDDNDEDGSTDSRAKNWLNDHSPLLDGHKTFEFTFKSRISGGDSFGFVRQEMETGGNGSKEMQFHIPLAELFGVDIVYDRKERQLVSFGLFLDVKVAEISASASRGGKLSAGFGFGKSIAAVNLFSIKVNGVIDIEKQSVGIEGQANLLSASYSAEIGGRLGPGIPAWLSRGVTAAVSSGYVTDVFAGARY